jgi:hypothetical protein
VGIPGNRLTKKMYNFSLFVDNEMTVF